MGTHALEIINLTKKYNDSIILNNINCIVNKGDFIGVVGHNGAGKSTLLKILVTLVKKSSGKVFIQGLDIDYESQKIKKTIGYMPQDFNFSHTETLHQVLINQAGYHGIRKSDVEHKIECYLKLFSLWERRHEIMRVLSGGMKRSVMLIRALISSPTLLILDEPTLGLDAETKIIVFDILKNINKNGTTIILVSHLKDDIFSLSNKRVILTGSQWLNDT